MANNSDLKSVNLNIVDINSLENKFITRGDTALPYFLNDFFTINVILIIYIFMVILFLFTVWTGSQPIGIITLILLILLFSVVYNKEDLATDSIIDGYVLFGLIALILSVVVFFFLGYYLNTTGVNKYMIPIMMIVLTPLTFISGYFLYYLRYYNREGGFIVAKIIAVVFFFLPMRYIFSNYFSFTYYIILLTGGLYGLLSRKGLSKSVQSFLFLGSIAVLGIFIVLCVAGIFSKETIAV